VKPFYFGPPARRLFGVYHAPPRPSSRDRAVLICQPVGHEYLRAHRAIRNLASLLARQGLAVLRFDYYGCGDSAGDGPEGTLTQWRADNAAAAGELKRLASVSRIAVVGVRLGAALAVDAAARRDDVELLVLWDPVLDGAAHLEELEALHEGWLRLGGRVDISAAGAPGPVLGFPYAPALRRELGELQLHQAVAAARRVTVLLSREHPADAAWRAGLAAAHGAAACAVVPTATDWLRPETVHTALAAPQMVQALASVIAA
jgi:uncharacterized protein